LYQKSRSQIDSLVAWMWRDAGIAGKASMRRVDQRTVRKAAEGIGWGDQNNTRDNVSPVLLNLVIPHGGCVIMHDNNMRMYWYYPHSVEPTSLMRFVLTMRQIGDIHGEQTESSKRRAVTTGQGAKSQPSDEDGSTRRPKDTLPTAPGLPLGNRKRGNS
jgi:hypothetical protein